jgi:hypothetical protein
MNSIPLSAWRTAYASALFETEQARMLSRIAEARSAIDERLQSPSEIGEIERKSIEAAQKGLAALGVERVVGTGLAPLKAASSAGT